MKLRLQQQETVDRFRQLVGRMTDAQVWAMLDDLQFSANEAWSAMVDQQNKTFHDLLEGQHETLRPARWTKDKPAYRARVTGIARKHLLDGTILQEDMDFLTEQTDVSFPASLYRLLGMVDSTVNPYAAVAAETE